jgi:hypothetical protein
MKTKYLAFCLIAATCGSALAEDEKPEAKPSAKIIAKVDRTKEFAQVVAAPKFRDFFPSIRDCFSSSAEDIAAGRNVFKHAFKSGLIRCSIIFKKRASLEESQVCGSDMLEYGKVMEAVRADGTYSYWLKVERAKAWSSGRPNPQIEGIVCDSPRKAIGDSEVMASFTAWNQVPSPDRTDGFLGEKKDPKKKN